MTRLFIACLTLLLSLPIAAQAEWLMDYRAAIAKAEAEDKAILVNFTGSDWCGWCVKLRREVFDTPEFLRFAEHNFVLLEVDFPKRKQLSTAQKQANERLSERFEITGFPTIIILNKGGVKIGQYGYLRGGPANYIAELKKTRGFVAREVPVATEASAPGATAPAAVTKKTEAPAYTIPPPVIRYDEIALKGISGGRVPMALINNKSFAAGEKANVKVGDKTVEITVKEIRENSVLAQFEGESEPRELKLKTKDDPKKD